MKIGIEVTGSLTERPTGIANYIVNLYKELENSGSDCELHPFVWISSYKNRKRFYKYVNSDRISLHYGLGNYHKVLDKFDISHSTDSKFLDLPGSGKVVTIHDLAIFRKEIIKVTDYTTPQFRENVRRNLEIAAKRSDRIITASYQTKIDFLEMFPDYDEAKIDPVHLAGTVFDDSSGESELEILRKFGIETNSYFIFVGAISARKNLINMIKGFKESGLSSDTKFLLVGFESMGAEKIDQAISDARLENKIVFADYIESSYFPALYRNSLGLAFATLYEGFGIPLVDAMASRIPFMHGNIGSAPEVANGFGVEVDPFNVGEIAEGFREMTKVSNGKIEDAFEHSKSFTWKNTAEKTIEVYRKLIL